MSTPSHRSSILGSLLGTAIGDALGLPAEGMTRQRIARRWGRVDRHHFLFGKGMISDDTEHTLMVAAALLKHGSDASAFQITLARSLRWWFAGLPAGVGLSTAKAILRLWIGIPPHRSGVYSAGNGAAMRSAIIGVYFRDDSAAREAMVSASTRVTHTDPRALEAARMVAEAAALFSLGQDNATIVAALAAMVQSVEMKERWPNLVEALTAQKTVGEYAVSIGCSFGVSGFAPNTVAVALYAALRHRDSFKDAVMEVITCGGDTDSVAAITGGILGAAHAESVLPPGWIANICEWPRSTSYIRELAAVLADRAEGKSRPAPHFFPSAVMLRNAVFLIIVLLHGFRRLLPPY